MLQHYHQVTNSYHSSPFHAKNSDLEQWQFKIIYTLLNMHPNSRNSILDLGAGTGRLAQLLIEQLGTASEVVCVDNSSSMLEQARNISGVIPICHDAVEYVSIGSENTFDCVILKEMIHHINVHNLEDFFLQIKRLLKPLGTFLICTRPQQGIEYPFFANAIERWQQCQPDVELYEKALIKTGFEQIKILQEAYPMRTTVEAWVDFIRNRLWSNFSHLHYSDQDLNGGIEEILLKYNNTKNIEFTEKQVFIKALNL